MNRTMLQVVSDMKKDILWYGGRTSGLYSQVQGNKRKVEGEAGSVQIVLARDGTVSRKVTGWGSDGIVDGDYHGQKP